MQIQKIRPGDITNLLRAKNSLFNKFIEIGNLREAALIANAILLSTSQETSMDLQKKYKVLFKTYNKGTKYLYEQNDDNNKNQFSKNRQV